MRPFPFPCPAPAGLHGFFRAELRKALEHLAESVGWAWEIDPNDLALISRTPSPSQQRHLAKKVD